MFLTSHVQFFVYYTNVRIVLEFTTSTAEMFLYHFIFDKTEFNKILLK